MKVVKDSPLELGYRVWQVRPPVPSLTVVVKGTFEPLHRSPAILAEDQQIAAGERRYEDDPEQSPRYPSDLAILKPRGECMLVGRAFTPHGVAMPTLECMFQVGPIRKPFVVHGDRTIARTRATPPVPFTSMPLRLERTYGGPGYERNPYGSGRERVETDSGLRRRLPNIEEPGASGPGERAPVLLGPLPADWPGRSRLMGTCDARWAKRRWPWFPEDFSYEFFLDAAEDQRLRDGFFAGTERVVLQNLHPQQPLIETRLPDLRPRAFLNVQRAEGSTPIFEELVLRLDTVTYDGEVGRLLVVWRGIVEVPSESLDEVHHLFVAHEPLSEPPRAVEEHYALFVARIAEEEAAEAAMEGEEPPAWEDEEGRVATTVRELEQIETRFFDGSPGSVIVNEPTGLAPEGTTALPPGGTVQTMVLTDGAVPLTTLVSATDERRGPIADATAVTDTSDLPPADGAPAFESADEQLARVEAELAALQAKAGLGAPPPPDPGAIERAESLPPDHPTAAAAAAAAAAARAAAQESPGEPWRPPDDDEPSEPEKTPRDVVLERLARGEPLSDLDLSGGDLSGLDLSGQDLARSVLAEASLVGTLLRGADLTDATLFRADLSGADLTSVRGNGANLSGVVATGVSFVEAELDHVVAERANLRGARLARCRARGALLTGANLREADLTAADLTEAEIDRANLRAALFVDAVLRDTSLEESRADDAIFDGADLTGARGDGLRARRALFRRVRGADSTWEDADLGESDFGFSDLSRAVFTGASLLAVGFDACVMREARLDGASLHSARARKADLMQASLEGADLAHADLRGSNLYQAELYRANVRDTQLELANIAGTKLVR